MLCGCIASIKHTLKRKGFSTNFLQLLFVLIKLKIITSFGREGDTAIRVFFKLKIVLKGTFLISCTLIVVLKKLRRTKLSLNAYFKTFSILFQKLAEKVFLVSKFEKRKTKKLEKSLRNIENTFLNPVELDKLPLGPLFPSKVTNWNFWCLNYY